MAAGTVTTEAVGTEGVSPKALLAFMLPALGTLVLALLDQLLSPDIDATLKVAIVGVIASALAFAGAWAGKPGDVKVVPVAVGAQAGAAPRR